MTPTRDLQSLVKGNYLGVDLRTRGDTVRGDGVRVKRRIGGRPPMSRIRATCELELDSPDGWLRLERAERTERGALSPVWDGTGAGAGDCGSNHWTQVSGDQAVGAHPGSGVHRLLWLASILFQVRAGPQSMVEEGATVCPTVGGVAGMDQAQDQAAMQN